MKTLVSFVSRLEWRGASGVATEAMYDRGPEKKVACSRGRRWTCYRQNHAATTQLKTSEKRLPMETRHSERDIWS